MPILWEGGRKMFQSLSHFWLRVGEISPFFTTVISVYVLQSYPVSFWFKNFYLDANFLALSVLVSPNKLESI